jgi:hypothetical protein
MDLGNILNCIVYVNTCQESFMPVFATEREETEKKRVSLYMTFASSKSTDVVKICSSYPKHIFRYREIFNPQGS